MNKPLSDRETHQLVRSVIDSLKSMEKLESSEALDAVILPPAIVSTWISLAELASANANGSGGATAAIAKAIMNNRYLAIVIVELMVMTLREILDMSQSTLESELTTLLTQENGEEVSVWSHRIMESLSELSAALEKKEQEEEG